MDILLEERCVSSDPNVIGVDSHNNPSQPRIQGTICMYDREQCENTTRGESGLSDVANVYMQAPDSRPSTST